MDSDTLVVSLGLLVLPRANPCPSWTAKLPRLTKKVSESSPVSQTPSSPPLRLRLPPHLHHRQFPVLLNLLDLQFGIFLIAPSSPSSVCDSGLKVVAIRDLKKKKLLRCCDSSPSSVYDS